MSRAQRLVLATYCLLVTYCCIWIPWQITCGVEHFHQYVEYSFLWAAPQDCRVHAITPHIPMLVLRIVAVTAISAAVFVLAGIRVSTGSKR